MFNSKVSFKKNTLSAYNLPKPAQSSTSFSLKTTQVEVKKNDITNPVVIDSEKEREDKEKQRIEEVKKQREKVLSLIKKSFDPSFSKQKEKKTKK